MQHLTPELVSEHNGLIVACYSEHPLVERLRVHPSVQSSTISVVGILEASVLKSLLLLRPGESYGIVSTGSYWESALKR